MYVFQFQVLEYMVQLFFLYLSKPPSLFNGRFSRLGSAGPSPGHPKSIIMTDRGGANGSISWATEKVVLDAVRHDLALDLKVARWPRPAQPPHNSPTYLRKRPQKAKRVCEPFSRALWAPPNPILMPHGPHLSPSASLWLSPSLPSSPWLGKRETGILLLPSRVWSRTGTKKGERSFLLIEIYRCWQVVLGIFVVRFGYSAACLRKEIVLLFQSFWRHLNNFWW